MSWYQLNYMPPWKEYWHYLKSFSVNEFKNNDHFGGSSSESCTQ